MKKLCRLVSCLFLLLFVSGNLTADAEKLEVAVLGLGGRVQGLLLNCLNLKLETGKQIHVAAVADPNELASLYFVLNHLESPLKDEYLEIFDGVKVYEDTEEGLKKLFADHPNLNQVLITSTNDRHLPQLKAVLNNSACKNIFIEKPLFKTLQDFDQFDEDTSLSTIHVGLTLRYAMMTKIAEAKLKEYKSALGALQKVSSWEHLNFGHSFTIIMMNWRRYKSLSGGLLIEKSVHDLDLALYLMQAAGAFPKQIAIRSEAFHHFYLKSNQNTILARLNDDTTLQNKLKKWETIAWQRWIPFTHTAAGEIDYEKTLHAFFKDFPDDDDFSFSDLIPDEQNLYAKIQTEDGGLIDYELSVKLNGFAYSSDRGVRFTFQNGEVLIDIEKGKMLIGLKDGGEYEYDLMANHKVHAGGDIYVAHTILGTLAEGQPKAVFNDLAVQLSTLMGLISEDLCHRASDEEVTIRAVDGKWVSEKSAIQLRPMTAD